MDEKKRGELNSFLFEFKGCQLLWIEEMRMRADPSSPDLHSFSSKVAISLSLYVIPFTSPFALS